MYKLALLIAGLSVGCLASDSIQCANGTVCPTGTQCDLANGGCIVEGQIEACAGLGERVACLLPDGDPGLCRTGVCLGHVCGDRLTSGPEQCDPTDPDMAARSTTCDVLGYYNDDPVVCAADCTWDRVPCSEFCGDKILNGNELCEPTIPIEGTCLDYSFDRGVLGCGACRASFVSCGEIGWTAHLVPANPGFGSATNAVAAVAINDPVTNSIAARLDDVGWTPIGTFTLPNYIPYGIAVAAVTATDIWAAGNLGPQDIGLNSGFVAHYDGSAWTLVQQFADEVTTLWASGPHVFAIEEATATVDHYDGATWTAQALTISNVGYTIAGTSPDDVWIAGGKLWHGGASQAFAEVTTPATGDITGVAALSGDRVIVVSQDSANSRMLLHLRQNGTWTTVPYPVAGLERAQIYATALDDVYVLFGAPDASTQFPGHVAHYDGTAWTPLSNDRMFYPTTLIGSPTFGVIAFEHDQQRAQHYTGSAWLPHGAPFPALNSTIATMYGPAGNEVYATGANGAVQGDDFRFQGWDWETVRQLSFGRVDGLSATTTYSYDRGAATPKMWHRTGPGTWASTALPTTTGSYDFRFAIAGVNDGFVTELISGVDYLRHWTGGTTLETTNMPDGEVLAAIDCHPVAGCYAIEATTVWYTPGSRNGWTTVTIPGIQFANALWIAADGDVFIGDGSGRIAHLHGGVWTVEQLPTSSPVAFLAGGTSSDLFALVQNVAGGDSLYHSIGAGWYEVRLPYATFAASATAMFEVDHRLHVAAHLPGAGVSMYELVRTAAW